MTTKLIHTRGYMSEPNPIWWIFLTLTEFGFPLISKHGYETDNGDIGTHPIPISKSVPNVENQFITHFI